MSDAYQRTLAHLGFTARTEQAALVTTLARGGCTVVQAGTGVGKSIAALTRAADVGRPGRPAIIITMTNALTRQYALKDAPEVAAATGVSFTRVIGRSHMLCASSIAAQNDGVPQAPEPVEHADDYDDTLAACVAEREAWLAAQVSPAATFATQWERNPELHGDDYACPGKCGGRILGGCGARNARVRAQEVHVVVTNAHCAVYQHLFPFAEILPAATTVIIDEAHQLPDVVAGILEARIGPKFGLAWADRGADTPLQLGTDWVTDRELRADLTLEARQMLDDLRAGIPWPERGGPTERRIVLSPATAARIHGLVDAYRAACSTLDIDPDEDAADTEEVGVLRTLVALADTATDPSIVATISRNDRETIAIGRADVSELVANILGDDAALISGTVGTTLARRCGWPAVQPSDVGHPFDYRASVRGYISRLSGIKTPPRHLRGPARQEWLDGYEQRCAARSALLDRFVRDGQTLILCSSHADIDVLARHLVPRLEARGRVVYMQPRDGGSQAALDQAAAFRAHYERHGSGAVLIGTESLTTGVDLPGDVLTRVAWWCLPLGMTSEVDKQRDQLFRGYTDDRVRIKVTQGIGRLIRRVEDCGEVLLCDNRFTAHLGGARTMLDRHLQEIPWSPIS